MLEFMEIVQEEWEKVPVESLIDSKKNGGRYQGYGEVRQPHICTHVENT